MSYDPIRYWEERGKRSVSNTDSLSEHDTGRNLLNWIWKYGRHGDKFLEVGSGHGRVAEMLFEHKLPRDLFSACDISKSCAKVHAEKTGIVPTIWDGITLPYENSLFDWVISFSVMLHVTPDQIENFVKEHLRVSKHLLFISTYIGSDKGISRHCFSHDYHDVLFRHVAWLEFDAAFDKQGQWLTRKII